LHIENLTKLNIDEIGIKQVSHTAEDFSILLTTVAKGKVFNSHHHVTRQYGYCFNGEFTFYSDEEPYNLSEGKEYLLQSDVVHSASATEDFYALDYRFLSSEDLPERINLQVLNKIQEDKNIKIKGKKLGKSKVFSVEGNGLIDWSLLNISTDEVIYIVSGDKTICNCSESMYVLKPMEIYKITDVTNFSVENNRYGLIIVKEE